MVQSRGGAWRTVGEFFAPIILSIFFLLPNDTRDKSAAFSPNKIVGLCARCEIFPNCTTHKCMPIVIRLQQKQDL